MDTYADDLSEIIATLYLKETKRVAKAALICAVPSLMLKTAANPDGSPIEVFDRIRLGCITNRSQFYKDLASSPFF